MACCLLGHQAAAHLNIRHGALHCAETQRQHWFAAAGKPMRSGPDHQTGMLCRTHMNKWQRHVTCLRGWAESNTPAMGTGPASCPCPCGTPCTRWPADSPSICDNRKGACQFKSLPTGACPARTRYHPSDKTMLYPTGRDNPCVLRDERSSGIDSVAGTAAVSRFTAPSWAAGRDICAHLSDGSRVLGVVVADVVAVGPVLGIPAVALPSRTDGLLGTAATAPAACRFGTTRLYTPLAMSYPRSASLQRGCAFGLPVTSRSPPRPPARLSRGR